MNILDSITLAIASLGAVLGIFNTWLAVDKSRIKIKVLPKHAIPLGNLDQDLIFCIEIINLSDFAITVDDVGVYYKKTKIRASITRPFLIDGGTWPRRLEPRSSVVIYSNKPEYKDYVIKCAYAKTSCGYIQTGYSPALKQIAKYRN